MPVGNQVEAQLKPIALVRRGRNRIRACNLFPADVIGERDELPRRERKSFDVRRLEDEVPDVRRDLDRLNETRAHYVRSARGGRSAISASFARSTSAAAMAG